MINDRRLRAWTAALMAGSVLALALGFLIMPKSDFSENENRKLASFPKLKWEEIESGRYMADLSAYLSDHFPFRDFFMGLKSGTELAQGRRVINGVYIADDGYLIEDYEKPENTERISGIFKGFAEKIDRINEESGRNVELRLMLVPTASCILRDKLPKGAPVGSQTVTMEEIREKAGIPFIDCVPALTEKKEQGQIYYRLDHHWTTYGAYAGYLAYCGGAGLAPVPLEELEGQTVTEDFCGTIYSKVNDYTRKGDEITIYVNPADRLTVNYTDTGVVSDSLYNLDYLEKKDKYSLFLDNLHSLIEITNANAETDRELVLLKDSYANSMVPYLVRHFKKIYVFDTRSYRLGPSNFIREHGTVTDVLILYNMNTLDSDLGIGAIY